MDYRTAHEFELKKYTEKRRDEETESSEYYVCLLERMQM